MSNSAARTGRMSSLYTWLGVFLATTLPALGAIDHTAENGAGFTAEPATASVEAHEITGIDSPTCALLLSGHAGGDIGGTLLWTLDPASADEGTVDILFVVDVNGEHLLVDHNDNRIPIGVYGYVVDGNGVIVSHLAQGLILDQAQYTEALRRTGLRYLGRVRLATGEYSLRIVVRNHSTGHHLLTLASLTVPDIDDPNPTLLPPLITGAETGWVVARQYGLDDHHPPCGDSRSVAAARPVLIDGEETALCLGGAGWGADSRFVARLIDRLGNIIAEPRLRVDAFTEPGLSFRPATLDPVLGLPRGEYTLQVIAYGADGQEPSRRGLPVFLARHEEVRGTAAMAGGPSTSVIGEESHDGRALRKRGAREAYIEALRTLANGDSGTAHQKLVALERRAATSSNSKSMTILRDAQQWAAERLGQTDLNSLLPVTILHRDLFRSYVARGQWPPASRACFMTADLAEFVGRESSADLFAQDVLVALATDLSRISAPSVARQMLTRALELDPTSAPALLGLGISYERTAQYADAVDAFRRLVDAHRGFSEGRLRLAVNLERTGKYLSADELYRGILAGKAPMWITVLAYQQLARSLVDRERLEEAEALLEEATTRLPTNQRLLILQAMVFDRIGRHQESVDLLAGLPAASRGPSPRVRYGQWPDLGSIASGRNPADEAHEARAALLKALNAIAPEKH